MPGSSKRESAGGLGRRGRLRPTVAQTPAPSTRPASAARSRRGRAEWRTTRRWSYKNSAKAGATARGEWCSRRGRGRAADFVLSSAGTATRASSRRRPSRPRAGPISASRVRGQVFCARFCARPSLVPLAGADARVKRRYSCHRQARGLVRVNNTSAASRRGRSTAERAARWKRRVEMESRAVVEFQRERRAARHRADSICAKYESYTRRQFLVWKPLANYSRRARRRRRTARGHVPPAAQLRT